MKCGAGTRPCGTSRASRMEFNRKLATFQSDRAALWEGVARRDATLYEIWDAAADIASPYYTVYAKRRAGAKLIRLLGSGFVNLPNP